MNSLQYEHWADNQKYFYGFLDLKYWSHNIRQRDPAEAYDLEHPISLGYLDYQSKVLFFYMFCSEMQETKHYLVLLNYHGSFCHSMDFFIYLFISVWNISKKNFFGKNVL